MGRGFCYLSRRVVNEISVIKINGGQNRCYRDGKNVRRRSTKFSIYLIIKPIDFCLFKLEFLTGITRLPRGFRLTFIGSSIRDSIRYSFTMDVKTENDAIVKEVSTRRLIPIDRVFYLFNSVTIILLNNLYYDIAFADTRLSLRRFKTLVAVALSNEIVEKRSITVIDRKTSTCSTIDRVRLWFLITVICFQCKYKMQCEELELSYALDTDSNYDMSHGRELADETDKGSKDKSIYSR